MAKDEAPRLRNADAGDDAAKLTVGDFIPPSELKLGLPFAIATDCDLLPAQPPHIPGAVAAVQCLCGGQFLLNLLRDQVSRCPDCKKAYTHALVVAPEDDTASVDAFVETVALANGIPDDEADDEADDDDGGDDDEAAGDEGDDDDAGDDDDDDDSDDDDDEAGDDETAK